jgi:hypothetical protein
MRKSDTLATDATAFEAYAAWHAALLEIAALLKTVAP